MGLGIVATLVIGGGLAWCYLVPSETDRFAHAVYGWLAMVVIAVVLNVARILYPDLFY